MPTTHSKSPVQIMRQRVLGPGFTEHNGRGVYDMDTERTFNEIIKRVKRLKEKTDLIVESVEIEEGKDHTSKTEWPYTKCNRHRAIVTFRATRDPKSNEKWYYRRFLILDCGEDTPASIFGFGCP